MKKGLKIGLLGFLISVILYFGHYVYTNYIHYKLLYTGHSATKENSIKKEAFISEFKPSVDSLNIDSSYTFFENAILEKKWESIGNPEIDENEKILSDYYQLIVPIELGTVDLEVIKSTCDTYGKQGFGYPIDMLVFKTERELREVTFAVKIRNGDTWDKTIIIDTITYRRINY